MPQVINTNIASLNAQRNLNTSQMSLQTSLQRLSSGLRINSAKDDAAGLAISDRMSAQIRGLNQAVRNANDGISLSQTAEGALSEVGNILQRMRELSIQAANATNSDSDRRSIQSEISQLKQELTRIAANTTFNGQKILNGSQQNISFQVGADANQIIGISIQDTRASALGTNVTLSNNVSNGLVRPTSYNRFATEGIDIGQAVPAAVGNNTVLGQTLTIRDASGSVLDNGTVTVVAKEQASDIAFNLNQIAGVTATAYTAVKLANWVSGTTGAANTFSVVVDSGATSAALNLSGVGDGSSQKDVFTALAAQINGNADLQKAGVAAGLDSTGNLVIRNNNGADIGVTMTTTGGAGFATAQYDFYGSDTGSVAQASILTSAATAESAGGQLSVFMANGYSITSSTDGLTAAAGGLFKSGPATAATAKESNVGIADVISGDATPNEVLSTGLIIGQAQAATAVVNGYKTQNIKVLDATGTQVGSTVVVAASASAQTISGQLNGIPGVTASATTTAVATFGVAAGAAFVLALNGTTVTTSGIVAGTTGAQVAQAVAAGINSNTTLTGQGFAATVRGDGKLQLTNSLGADIKWNTTGTTDVVTTLQGSDQAATAIVVTNDKTVVGGTLKIALADGYTIQSSVAGTVAAAGLFAGGANSAAAVTTNGVNVGNSVAAQKLTLNGAAGSATATIARNDTADVIANKINANSATTGISASARTQAKLSNISAAGTVNFTLYGINTSGVTVSGAVTGAGSTANLSGLANAINTVADQTGITASLADNDSSIVLTQADGKNIALTNFSHSAAVTAYSGNINGTDQSIQVSGLTQSVDTATGNLKTSSTAATTLHAGGVGDAGADSTTIGGTLTFQSEKSFSVASSISGDNTALSGGKSSLFSGVAGMANASSLESITGVDVSTVDGANNAISVVDAALTQVNSVRAALGAIQNRMQSTISSLSAGSENLSAARSRIQDADFAAETANLTRSQILQQAGVAMLAQANQLPQMVLKLLQ